MVKSIGPGTLPTQIQNPSLATKRIWCLWASQYFSAKPTGVQNGEREQCQEDMYFAGASQ